MPERRRAVQRGLGRRVICGVSVLLGSGLILLASDLSRAAELRPLKGRPLVEVLDLLREQGLNLIFSTAVVKPELRVTVEPKAAAPRAVLDAILPPLDLQAIDGHGGTVLIVPLPAYGRDASDEPARRKGFVEEVVVTPSRHTIVPPEQASRRTVESADSVLAPAIGGDISRHIELLPGVAAPDNSAAFNARGARSHDVSMVLDGLELYEPFHLQSLQSPFSFVDSKVIDRIEFLGGGFTAELGDRHGGFVELSTSQPGGAAPLRVEAGTLSSSVSYSHSMDRGSFLVSARTWYPEAFRNTIEAGEDGLDPRFGDVYGKISFTSLTDTVISVHGLVANDRLRFKEPDGSESLDLANVSSYLWVRGLRSWGSGVFTETALSAGRLDQSRSGLSEPGGESVAVEDDRVANFFGFKQDVSWEFSDQMLRGGLEIRPIRANYAYRTEANGVMDETSLTPVGTSYGAYVAHRSSLSRTFSAEVGLRWDAQTYTRESLISPRLNGTWRPTDRTEVRLGVGRFSQSQRIHEILLEDGDTEFHPAEISDQAALTFLHRFDVGLRFRLDAYYHAIARVQPRYENLFSPIELYPESEPDRVLIEPDRARLRGVELLLQGHEGRAFHWWTSYTWSSAEDVEHGGGVPRSWDQTHAGKFLIGYRHQDAWTVALTGTAHTGWPTTPVTATSTTLPTGEVVIDPVLGERNSDRFSPYLRLDFRASRSFPVGGSRMELTFDVLNVTDRSNPCCVDEFRFTPHADGSVDVEPVTEDWLGITPTFSVLWEF